MIAMLKVQEALETIQVGYFQNDWGKLGVDLFIKA